MLILRINQNSQMNSEIKERWIREQIQNRRVKNESICVEFEVHCDDVNMIFPFGNCSNGSGGGGKSQLSKRALRLIDDWKEVKDKKINPGLVVSFWKHLKRVCN